MISVVYKSFSGNRIGWSRAILAFTLFFAVFSEPPEYINPWVGDCLEITGFIMLVFATLWRIWCLIFIGGVKDGQLVTTGPYSVTRNPLYLAHFFGVTGFGLAVGLPMLALSLSVIFGVLYPAVVAQEESRLAELFGEDFQRYCKKVPRWIPDWSQYSAPETVTVSVRKIQQGILDGMWYPWAIALAEVIEILREHHFIHYLI